jgi:hypothetical protein
MQHRHPIGLSGRGLLATLLLLSLSSAAEPHSDRPLPDFTDPAWKPFSFGSIDRHTSYHPVEGTPGWLRSESECAASARIVPLRDLDLARTPILHWRWRVDRALEIADERSKPGDDFAARVYVMFRFQPEKASLFQRLRHRIGAAAYDLEPPGTALSLVWSSREPEGESWKSPYGEESAMRVVASGATRETGTWYKESMDVAATYRQAFGAEPPPLLALGVMTDADNSCGQASAGFAEFRFSTRP